MVNFSQYLLHFPYGRVSLGLEESREASLLQDERCLKRLPVVGRFYSARCAHACTSGGGGGGQNTHLRIGASLKVLLQHADTRDYPLLRAEPRAAGAEAIRPSSVTVVTTTVAADGTLPRGAQVTESTTKRRFQYLIIGAPFPAPAARGKKKQIYRPPSPRASAGDRSAEVWKNSTREPRIIKDPDALPHSRFIRCFFCRASQLLGTDADRSVSYGFSSVVPIG